MLGRVQGYVRQTVEGVQRVFESPVVSLEAAGQPERIAMMDLTRAVGKITLAMLEADKPYEDDMLRFKELLYEHGFRIAELDFEPVQIERLQNLTSWE